ncbi:nucleoside triphosphate pyrophosphohydrolase [Sporosarcina sp. Te-1]|uniref:nucleoside triphosphate pyrophosphohydrolase n=1 Tax=Sporosarcina sp. Te-1 TaxID=2818390 RepID=UPI001A9F8A9E|nr:nucleoside triphosphate pyrophosphohydrolase [Sporosarcina sp. Te-1]QTD39659.1 nucleoside triphosphate pyrophosphohydrolase [Sporosarcina sp. Te-1]
MPTYNKLVRDLIPKIIQDAGQVCRTRILGEEEYIMELNKKMHEELAEYEAAENAEDAIEELADLLELIYAAASYHEITFKELDKIRAQKAEKRGGFEERLFLMDVEEE